MTSEGTMHCVCGHAERHHVPGGRCRVPDCPCEHFQPGDSVAERVLGTRTGMPPQR